MFSGAVFDYAIPRSTHSRYPAGSEIGFQDVPILCLVLLDRDFRVYNDKDGRTKINIAPFDENRFPPTPSEGHGVLQLPAHVCRVRVMGNDRYTDLVAVVELLERVLYALADLAPTLLGVGP
jgi:hypothetical protein